MTYENFAKFSPLSLKAKNANQRRRLTHSWAGRQANKGHGRGTKRQKQGTLSIRSTVSGWSQNGGIRGDGLLPKENPFEQLELTLENAAPH